MISDDFMKSFLFKMNIEEWITDRLVLKLTKEEDIEELAPMLLDQNVSMYLNEHITKFPNIEIAKSFLSSVISYCPMVFTIRIKENDEIIGQIGYCVDNGNLTVSYWLGTKYQGNGYASEAAVELSYNVFKKSSIDTFSISFHSQNMGSRKLAYKIGEKMLERNPEWIVLDKEDQVTECEVSYLDENHIAIQMNIVGKKKTEYLCCDKSLMPDEYQQVGKKYKEILRFLDISKNGN